jgi:hypothetical protein
LRGEAFALPTGSRGATLNFHRLMSMNSMQAPGALAAFEVT